jgi:large subunit ribosomal protein L17
MRHRMAGRRLNRTSEHLQALLANLVTALIQHEQIRTTLPKAKETRRVAERLITLAKDNALHRRRQAAQTIRDAGALQKLFATLGPRFKLRPGGYTRIVKLGPRLGDAAPMALLELVERSPKAPAEPDVETKDQKEGLEKALPKGKAGKAKAAAEGAETKAVAKGTSAAKKAKAEPKAAKPAKKPKKKSDE